MGDTRIKPGVYLHFKGKEHQVIGVAMHSENYEDLVVYRELFGNRELWARPYSMFVATVEHNGEEVPRFKYLREYDGE